MNHIQRVLFSILAVNMLTGHGLSDDNPAESVSRHVDPFISTGGNRLVCGNNPPAATVPFGVVRLCPDTTAGDGQRSANLSGYFYDDPFIMGFSHTRLCGTGAVDGGHFRVVPGIDIEQRGDVQLDFDHKHESASVGYYCVDLPSVNVKTELTASQRVGVHRYTFGDGAIPSVLIDVGSALGKGRSEACQVEVKKDEREITGRVRTFGSFSGRYGGLQVYFAARFNQPWESASTWSDNQVTVDGTDAGGDDVGVIFTFGHDDRPVELFLALSHVSIDHARQNLTQECGFSTFDDIRRSAAAKWEVLLSTARVDGGTPADHRMFYTALYHSCMMPTVFSDVNGDYTGFDRHVHRADGFTYYTDMSLWDTFRTTHPLYTLLMPDRHRDMLVSLVAMAKQGGNLPRWPSGTGYTGSMFGAPAEIVIADAYLKGIRDFDVKSAYRIMRKAALEAAPRGASYSSRRDIAAWLKHGYCPSDLTSGAVAKTLEYASTDAAIGRLAEALGHADDAKLFAMWAQNYRNLWNPQTQYFQPKDSAGEFSTPFNPTILTYVDFNRKFTDDYVEGSALQWRWAVSHDATGLVSLFTSKDEFAGELNAFFEGSLPQVGALPNGYYWQGNQPDIHAAYLFNAAGRPDLTQKWIRWILKHKHDDSPVGLDGNDDGGTLSAWYVFSSLGFYPVVGTDRYEIGSPLWDRAVLKLGIHELEIVAENNSPKNIYVERVDLNGRELKELSFTHDDISRGGLLHFVMTAQPAKR